MRREDGKGREPVQLTREATGNRESSELILLEPTSGESFLARNRALDALVPLQITIQSINFPHRPTGKEKAARRKREFEAQATFAASFHLNAK